MFYSEDYYEKTKTAAEIIKSSNLKSFPINPAILARRKGIKIISYTTFSRLTDISLERIASVSADGFSVRKNGQYFIIYNPNVTPKARRRWTLVHELCHIKSGHIGEMKGKLPTYMSDRPTESEADELTCCLIAPLPVALLCGVNSEAEFAGAFGLSRQASINLYKDYTQYRLNNHGDIPLEIGYGDSLHNFTDFVLYRNRVNFCIGNRIHVNPDIYYDESKIIELKAAK